jgi:hypothetical protein
MESAELRKAARRNVAKRGYEGYSGFCFETRFMRPRGSLSVEEGGIRLGSQFFALHFTFFA